jgi:dTDP-4-amino-4,6-dideoxygalactose transaminase
LNLDPQQVEQRITPRTRAILPVDYAGHPADLDPIRKIAADRGLIVIEDASHALGAQYRDRNVGSISDMTVFSFHPVKHITTGEGGMVTTTNSQYAETLRRFRNHGISSDARQRQSQAQWYYEMVLLGFNYRLTDIACALGIRQLRRLDENVARRRAIALKYHEELSGFPQLILPVEKAEVRSSWHLFPIRLRLERLTADRAQVFRALRAENIGVNVHYIPVHSHPYYRDRFGYKGGEYPVAEQAYERLISLPMFHGMTERDVEDVTHAVHKVLTYFASDI